MPVKAHIVINIVQLSSLLFSSIMSIVPTPSAEIVGTLALPLYAPLIGSLLMGIETASEAVADSSAAADQFTMTMADRVPAMEVTDGASIFVPLDQPIIGEANFTFLCDCRFAILRFRGRPGLHSTFAEIIGYSAGDFDRPLALGSLVTFATAVNLFVAKGDLLKAIQSPDTEKESGPELKKQKTGTSGQQSGVGVLPSATTTGEKIPLHITDLEGVVRLTRNKTDLHSREKDLRFGFRAVDSQRWVHLMGGDWCLQPIEYARMVTEQSQTRSVNRDPAFSSCGLLARVEELIFINNSDKVKAFLSGNICTGAGASVEMDDFTVHLICTLSKVDISRNRNLIGAIKNLGLLMEVYLSSQYKGVFSSFIEHLEGSDQPFELVSAGYLKYSIELVLRNFFRTVRSKKSVDPPFVAIASPNECAIYMTDLFHGLFIHLSDHGERKLGEERVALSKERAKVIAIVDKCPQPDKVVARKAAAVKPAVGKKSRCFNFFGQSINAIHAKTKKPYLCDNVECVHSHQPVKGKTKTELISIADAMPYHSKADCRAAIEKMSF